MRRATPFIRFSLSFIPAWRESDNIDTCIADLQTENREHYQGTEDNNIVIIYLSLYCILYVFF